MKKCFLVLVGSKQMYNWGVNVDLSIKGRWGTIFHYFSIETNQFKVKRVILLFPLNHHIQSTLHISDVIDGLYMKYWELVYLFQTSDYYENVHTVF